MAYRTQKNHSTFFKSTLVSRSNHTNAPQFYDTPMFDQKVKLQAVACGSPLTNLCVGIFFSWSLDSRFFRSLFLCWTHLTIWTTQIQTSSAPLNLQKCWLQVSSNVPWTQTSTTRFSEMTKNSLHTSYRFKLTHLHTYRQYIILLFEY